MHKGTFTKIASNVVREQLITPRRVRHDVTYMQIDWLRVNVINKTTSDSHIDVDDDELEQKHTSRLPKNPPSIPMTPISIAKTGIEKIIHVQKTFEFFLKQKQKPQKVKIRVKAVFQKKLIFLVILSSNSYLCGQKFFRTQKEKNF